MTIPEKSNFLLSIAQLKLRTKSFLIVGAGGLGSPAALYLGAGGVGRLGIVDNDTVDTNNLHRQVIHTEARKGVNKAVSAATAVKAIYPEVEVIPYAYTLDRTNALDLIKQYVLGDWRKSCLLILTTL